MHRTPLANEPAVRDPAKSTDTFAVRTRPETRRFGFPATSALRTPLSRPVQTAPWSVFQDGSYRRVLGSTSECTVRPPRGEAWLVRAVDTTWQLLAPRRAGCRQ